MEPTIAAKNPKTKPENDVVYTGIFIEPMDAQRLIRTFGQGHPERHAHHMTISHFSEGEHDLNLPWGKTVPLKVLGHMENDDVQVIVVQPPPSLHPTDRIPHITVSTNVGIGPKESNTLLEGWKGGQEHGLPTIKGKVGWVDTKQQVHYEPPPPMPD